LARWFFGYVALLAAYALFRRIFAEQYWARTALLLAVLGAGLGWLQLIGHWVSGEYPPVDLWLIDAYFLFSLSLFPHFAFVTAGLCIGLTLWLDYLQNPRWQNVALIALTGLLVQFANPIAFAAVDAAFAGAALISWLRDHDVHVMHLKALLVLAAAQIPLLAYNLVILSRDPIWSQFTAQNRTPSPPPDYYLWSFGLFWPLAIAGAITAFRQKKSGAGAATFWVITAFSLAYAPFNIQRRFLHGITIPLAVLAIEGLRGLFSAPALHGAGAARWRTPLVLGFVCLASTSTLYLGVGQTLFMQTRPPKYFYSADLEQGIQWLKERARPGDFALGAKETGSLLAQRAGLRVYLGHPMETLDYDQKQVQVLAFYQGRLADGWLSSTPIRWVIYGPYERLLAPGFQPEGNLTLMYDSNDVAIYMVK